MNRIIVRNEICSTSVRSGKKPKVEVEVPNPLQVREKRDEDHAYDIEWGGFLSNHLAHGQWALETLGDKGDLYETFTRLYKSRLEPLTPLKQSFEIATTEDLRELRGQRRDFLPQRNFFEREISKHGVETTITKHLPSLIRGIAGAAMHPIIHLSIGILSKRDLVVAEGLAYLNHSYLAAIDTDGQGDIIASRPRDVAAAEAVDLALSRKPLKQLATAGRFQRAMGGLLNSVNSTRALEVEASRILHNVSIEDDMLVLNTKSGDSHSSFTSIDFLFFHALRTYVGTGSNDYFLLHGLHCAFALQAIFDAFPSLPITVQRDASQALKIALIATDWIQGCQPVAVTVWEKEWQGLVGCDNTSFSLEKAEQYIEDRIQILLHENASVPRNEHVYKCAAVCRMALSSALGTRRYTSTIKPLTERECRCIVDLCAAVNLCMSRDFYGRGIGEKPTKAVNISSEHFRMSQLVLEEEKKQEDDCEPASIISEICYTEPPKDKRHRACLNLDNPGACPLRPGTVAAQHGSIPLEEEDEVVFEACNTLHPCSVNIWNARSFNGIHKPTLDRVGFQLIDIPRSNILSTEEGLKSTAANHPVISREVYSEIARSICEASGATAAFGYCHAMRVPDLAKSKGRTSSGYAGYAHSDQSHDSWCCRLPELVKSGEWSAQGPPGIDIDVAERAASSSRYAVLAAWRYLGPSDKCRASHLAILDHNSVKSSDLVRLSLIANGCLGGNYRLSSNIDTVDRHQWYYYPGMTREEALLFTLYDSNHPAKETTFAETPIATCIHSAFQDPNPPENEPTRRSMDIRFLLVWD